MTTKTDDIHLQLPPLPGGMVEADACFPGISAQVLEWGRGAIAADRQGHGNTLDMDVVAEKLRDMAASAYETAMAFGVSQDSFERLARQVFDYALLSRCGSSQPAVSAEPDIIREALEAARNGLEWYRDRCPAAVDGSDDEADELIGRALASLDAAPVAQKAAFYINPKVIDPSDGTIARGVDEALTWCREATRSHSMAVYAAPVAQEPVVRVRVQHRDGEVLDPCIEHTSSAFDDLPNGTVLDLYAAPLPPVRRRGQNADLHDQARRAQRRRR